jgi:hypothetical protein
MICSVSESQWPAITLLREHFDARPFRVSDAVAAGVSRTTLHRLRERGVVEKAGRGVMHLAGGGMGTLSDLAVVSARVPDGTICLNSALSYWDLTDEIPERVHLAVPRGAWRPAISEPLTQVHVFAADTFEVDREQVQTDIGELFWIYSPERSVIDAIRMSRWVGLDVGLHALRRYVNRRGSNPARLVELARVLGGSSRVQQALEALLS